MAASSGPIPSNPQVPILPFPHHSMLLLSTHTSEAEAVTSIDNACFLSTQQMTMRKQESEQKRD